MRTLRFLLLVSLVAVCLRAFTTPPALAGQPSPSPSRTPAPSATPAPTAKPLSRGASGKAVKAMQNRLTELGFTVRSKNAKFALNTYEELKKFQHANGLEETGELDARTAEVLYGDAAVRATPTPAPFDPANPMPRTASALVEFAKSRLGMGYVYGSSGERSSPWLRARCAEKHPKYAGSILGVAKKWDGIEVYDCVGLCKAFLARSAGDFPKAWRTNVSGAFRTWMAETGAIDTMPREPGILLLQYEPEKESYTHMGVYVGGGKCVHSRGHIYGVVEDPMPQLWTHWGRPIWLEYDLPEEEHVQWPPYLAAGDTALVDTSFGGDLPVRAFPRSTGAYTGARLPNQSLITIDAVPEDPEAWFWRKVTTTDRKGNSVTGYVYAKDLTAIP